MLYVEQNVAITAVTLVLFWMARVDVVTGKTRGSVINTKSFGGQCRTFYSGVHNNFYRLPLSVLQYTVTVGLLENSHSQSARNILLAYVVLKNCGQ